MLLKHSDSAPYKYAIKEVSALKLVKEFCPSSKIMIELLKHHARVEVDSNQILPLLEFALEAGDSDDYATYKALRNNVDDTIDLMNLLPTIIKTNFRAGEHCQKLLTEELKYLLEKNINKLNINAPEQENKKNKENKKITGEVVLFSAVHSGNAEMVKLLLKHGVNPDCKDPSGYPPLYHVATNKNTAVAQALIDNGATINVKEFTIESPLRNAVKNNNEELVKLLLEKGAEVNIKEYFGISLLHSAILVGNNTIAKWLMKKGANVNSRNGSLSPLQMALQQDNIDIAEELIRRGADVNHLNHERHSLLYHAAKKQNSFFVKMLLKEGAHANLESSTGLYPLHIAIETGKNIYIADILLSHGAHVNTQDYKGRTPLHYADSIEKVKLLLRHGASNMKDDQKQLPTETCKFDWMFRDVTQPVAEIISEAMKEPQTLQSLSRSCIRSRLARIEKHTPYTKPFRQKIAELGLPESVQSYVESGLNPNIWS